jgi:hypothetical protein
VKYKDGWFENISSARIITKYYKSRGNQGQNIYLVYNTVDMFMC